MFENIAVFGYPEMHTVTITSEGKWIASTAISSDNQFALMPGFFDTHIHGYAGVDFSDAGLTNEKLVHLTAALGQTGLSYCMATFVSAPDALIQQNIQVINEWIKQQENKPLAGHTQILGLHFEGPFISSNCRGAHCVRHIQAEFSFELLAAWCDRASACPYIKITISPELDNAVEFVRKVQMRNAASKQKIQVFIGHSNAPSHSINAVMQAGAKGFTHLGNANQEQVHRQQTKLHLYNLQSHMVQWAIDPSHTALDYGIELITDGNHISDEFIRLVHLYQSHKIMLVSDALGPSGLADGKYTLGDIPVYKKDHAFYIKDSAILAGSACAYPEIVARYAKAIHKKNNDLWRDVYQAAVVNPRRFSFSSEDDLYLQADCFNFVVLDAEGHTRLACVHGKCTL